jgi:hypothetical protein
LEVDFLLKNLKKVEVSQEEVGAEEDNQKKLRILNYMKY